MPIAIVTLAEAGGPDTFYEAETRYRGHVSVVGPGHSLQTSNLSWKDAGPYRAHMNLRSSRITRTREYQLQFYALSSIRKLGHPEARCVRQRPLLERDVITTQFCAGAPTRPSREQLARPRVTLSSRIGESGHCIFILTCEAESRGGSVTYSWLPLGPRTVVSRGGSVLSVSSRLRDRALTFTCVVKNPVSNSSSLPVSVPSSCPGPGILGGDTVGETVTGLLGDLAILPLEVPVGQEVEKVTWSSGELVAIMQAGPGGQRVLAAGSQAPYSRRWSALHRGYSLQIRPLRLQDSGLYRAWITLPAESPDQHHQGFHPARLREAAGAQYHCQLPDHEGWGLLHHPDLLPVTGRRGCSVQMGTPWPGGSYVPWGNHSPCLLETRGQRQLSLHG
ncbi:T-lymphocyte surface antigen Ly-9-like [Leptonychotes weddellii]|uniref:T-lymphocyte surface antigen Ly-9-like n=1 Tax=Leptonychotes weddellii TaxID=9713 RepID=A0A7F8RT26_LEPWE|nr:T-lymphocyte surface antigen Ly-9-like [Leptonychotes weddellii]